MKPGRISITIAAVFVISLLGACASTELAYHSFEGEPLRLVVRVAPDARVDADYFVTIDPNNPVGTIISIGSSVAKASQVESAQRKMDVALRELDVRSIMEDEVGGYFEDVMEMRLTDSRRDASYYLSVEVREYGIEASGPGSSVEFVLSGSAELYDTATDDRIWRERFARSLQVSPAFFGLPSSAGNVVSAAMLSELTEEQIASGIERVTRDAAWEVGREFEDDLYRARRRR
ncbi:MAG TPA: hypothetical protein VKA06_02905 [Spirochaetia bacterium]|nr:hypothetical protein [Spirochaetia bacterium]